MHVDVVRSGDAVAKEGQLLSTYILNERIAIDAGVLGTMVPADVQAKVSDIFLSHCHMDHVTSLPFFLEQRSPENATLPTIYANDSCIDALKKHFFNDLIWPDLVRIEREENIQFCRFEQLAAENVVSCHGLQVTAMTLSHTVPTYGFLVSDSSSVIGFVSDTEYSTSWMETLNGLPHLTCLFLECTFPTRLQWLADKSKHMTPRDIERFARDWKGVMPRIIINHSKPNLLDEVRDELQTALGDTIEMVETGREYVFE